MKEIRNGRLIAAGQDAEPAGVVGVFETVRLWNGEPAFFDEHARRYAAGCDFFNLQAAPDADILRQAARQLIEVNAISEGVLRWAVWRCSDSAIEWRAQADPPRPHMRKALWRARFAAAIVPPSDSGAAYKHLNRQLWREELAAARAAGFDEAVFSDAKGRVVEGAISNIFLVKDGQLLTPSLSCGPLPGLARARVLAWAAELGIAVRETELPVAELKKADEL
ncbi:MAG: aminotransferase class IV, partial [Verrucomicrobiota bacterium]|nr:aminotransferase class IV [Verrucomicrobiota bacterium]